ncbi:MAG: hypothetical protein ABI824_00640 [Acidobacteriota bacterium]
MIDACKLCGTRRAKRACPGVDAGICATCCATGREVTIDCPLDCPFLMEARLHERPAPIAPQDIPNRDVEVSEEFVRDQEHLVLWFCHSLARAMESRKAVDYDAREALDSSIKTLRATQSGLVYEARPENPYAADILDALTNATEELRKAIVDESGMASLRDVDLLGTLIFIQRLELQHNNGRRRGRAFYDFLLAHFPAKPAPDVAQALAIGGDESAMDGAEAN